MNNRPDINDEMRLFAQQLSSRQQNTSLTQISHSTNSKFKPSSPQKVSSIQSNCLTISGIPQMDQDEQSVISEAISKVCPEAQPQSVKLIRAIRLAYVVFPSVQSAVKVEQALNGKLRFEELGGAWAEVKFTPNDSRYQQTSNFDHSQIQQEEMVTVVHEDWICENCKVKNFSKRDECFQCREQRTDNARIIPVVKQVPAFHKPEEKLYIQQVQEKEKEVILPSSLTPVTFSNQKKSIQKTDQQHQVLKMKRWEKEQAKVDKIITKTSIPVIDFEIPTTQSIKTQQNPTILKSDKKLKDNYDVHVCLPCKRLFTDRDWLKKHQEQSTMHSKRLYEAQQKKARQENIQRKYRKE